jgi:hypothetical protein
MELAYHAGYWPIRDFSEACYTCLSLCIPIHQHICKLAWNISTCIKQQRSMGQILQEFPQQPP